MIRYIKEYFDSGIRIGQSKPKVVILSIRPDDIAGMSTDRRWSSCLNLDDGSNRESVYCEISNGGFAAYLVEKDDLEIENPVARIWVRRFDSIDGKTYALPEEEVYSDGRDFPEFLAILKDWLKERQGDLPVGTYFLSGGEYSDTFEEEHVIESPRDFSAETILETITDPKINKSNIQTLWKVTDEFYNNFYELFDQEGGLSLSFFHLVRPKVFSSKEGAEEWIANNNSMYWKDQIIELLRHLNGNCELIYKTNDHWSQDDETEDNHDIPELEGYSLTEEGLELLKWADWNSPIERWELTEDTVESQIKRRESSVLAAALSWIISQLNKHSSKKSLLEEHLRANPKKTRLLKEQIEGKMSNAPELQFSKAQAARLIYKKFPSFFPEERDRYKEEDNGKYFPREIADLLENLDEGEEKEALKHEAYSLIQNALREFDKVKKAYDEDAFYYGDGINIHYYMDLILALSKDTLFQPKLEKIILDLKNEVHSKAERKDRFEGDILTALNWLGAKSPGAIEFYSDLLEEAIESGVDSYLFNFENLIQNLFKVGGNGKSLLPALEKLYRELRKRLLRNHESYYGQKHKAQEYMRSIYRIVKNIRDNTPSEEGRTSLSQERKLTQELFDLI